MFRFKIFLSCLIIAITTANPVKRYEELQRENGTVTEIIIPKSTHIIPSIVSLDAPSKLIVAENEPTDEIVIKDFDSIELAVPLREYEISGDDTLDEITVDKIVEPSNVVVVNTFDGPAGYFISDEIPIIFSKLQKEPNVLMSDEQSAPEEISILSESTTSAASIPDDALLNVSNKPLTLNDNIPISKLQKQPHEIVINEESVVNDKEIIIATTTESDVEPTLVIQPNLQISNNYSKISKYQNAVERVATESADALNSDDQEPNTSFCGTKINENSGTTEKNSETVPGCTNNKLEAIDDAKILSKTEEIEIIQEEELENNIGTPPKEGFYFVQLPNGLIHKITFQIPEMQFGQLKSQPYTVIEPLQQNGYSIVQQYQSWKK